MQNRSWGTPKSKPGGTKIEVRRPPGGVLGTFLVSCDEKIAKSWPTWRQVGSQNGAKIEKKSMQKSSKKCIPFKSEIFLILMDFGREIGYQNRVRKWCLVRTTDFHENLQKTMVFQ